MVSPPLEALPALLLLLLAGERIAEHPNGSPPSIARSSVSLSRGLLTLLTNSFMIDQLSRELHVGISTYSPRSVSSLIRRRVSSSASSPAASI